MNICSGVTLVWLVMWHHNHDLMFWWWKASLAAEDYQLNLQLWLATELCVEVQLFIELAAALMSFSTSSAANRTRWKVWGGFWILHLHQFDVDDSCSDDVMEAEIKTKKGKRAGNWKIPRFDLYAFWGPLPPHSMQGQVCIDSLNNWSHCKENPSWFWRGQRGAVLGFDWLHVDRSCRYHT